MGPRYKGQVAKDMPIKTRAEAAKLAQELLKIGYIHRSQRVQHAHSRRWELELLNAPFEDSKDAFFTWVYEGSKTKLYLMCGGMLAGALGLCMIQIWPLWLKIGVWWCSVTFLTTFGILSVVRLVLFVLMYMVGIRARRLDDLALPQPVRRQPDVCGELPAHLWQGRPHRRGRRLRR